MSAQSNANAVEQRRLDEIVSQLRLEGWTVTTEPRRDSLPEALHDRQVDFIARRGAELLVGELASRNTAKQERIDLLARLVEQIPNARLQVYWLGDSSNAKPDFHQVQRYIKEADAVSDISTRAGLLMAMAALEGAVAAFAQGVDVNPAMPSRQLLSHLYSLGFIDSSHFDKIDSLYRLRSEIAHLTTPREPTHDDVRFCLDLADRMLGNRYVSADRIDDWFLNSGQGRGPSAAAVPWSSMSPNTIEQIIAVLLGNFNEKAMRSRLPQGDGGLDVAIPTDSGSVDVYQIKSFSTRLNVGQKRQIVDSLIRAREIHEDPSINLAISKWLLTIPLDPTKGELNWLRQEAARLGAPFQVEWRGRSFLDGLAAEYPSVIDYYLRDGQDRLQETTTILRDPALLSSSIADAAAAGQGDISQRLATVFQAINREDPHYRYDFEVTASPPIYFERPYLVASITDHLPDQYITFHVYARYADAFKDRPIPIDFQVSREELTPEASAAVDEMLRYGAPLELPASAITGLNIDLPAGLGVANATGTVRLGPTRGEGDKPSRVVWAIVAADGEETFARLTFQLEAPTRGQLGGLFVRGVDTTGVVAVAIQVDPPTDEDPKIGLSVKLIDPLRKPIQQVLPGLRFIEHFHSPNRLAFGPEYGHLTSVDTPRLPEGLHAIPSQVLAYAEALDAISRSSGLPVEFPELSSLTNDDYRNIISVGRLLRGEHVQVTWSAVTARVHPGSIEAYQADSPQLIMTAQDLAVKIGGAEYRVGRSFTHLLSARIVGDLTADPDADGNIEITIVPGGNDQAIMTTEALTPESIEKYSNEFLQPNDGAS